MLTNKLLVEKSVIVIEEGQERIFPVYPSRCVSFGDLVFLQIRPPDYF